LTIARQAQDDGLNKENARFDFHLDARKTELELPEEIDLQVELANVGSRTLAILVDIALGDSSLYRLRPHHAAGPQRRGRLACPAQFQCSENGADFADLRLQWCYFNLFEWIWNGQTPGKRLLHLRVIKVDGAQVSGIDVLLRTCRGPSTRSGRWD